MKYPAILIAAAALASGCSTTGASPLVEQGYERGSLGVAAIAREDWDAAERNINEARSVRADDPARLINLGRVYMATGRRSEALAAWRRALASERQLMVETITGEVISTHELARRALALYDQDVRTASVGTR